MVDLLSRSIEDMIDTVLDKLLRALVKSSPAKYLEYLREMAPTLDSRRFPTPLGELSFPNIDLVPEIGAEAFNQRELNVIKAAIGSDLSSIIGLIPGIGGFISNEITDLYMARMRDLMIPKEYDLFIEYDKGQPLDAVAAVRAVVNARK